MVVKFLKAGSGDSILIHHEGYNILIDGGNDSTHLLREVDKLYKNGQVIDLLMITHHDDDHIKGIIDLLEQVVTSKLFGEPDHFIKKVIFNSPRLILGKIEESEEKELSYKQAYDVEELLRKLKTDWLKYTVESEPITFGNLNIHFLSPTQTDLDKYSSQSGAYLSGDYKCDWKTPLSVLDKYLSDSSQDRSIANRSSVVIQVECEGKKVLLTGDVTPKRLKEITDKLVAENEGEPVSFDLVKLPHHGSYRSLNEDILSNLKCKRFVISTNSKKHYHPNKRALLKVLKYIPRDKEQISFLFNYRETIELLGISEKEKKDFNFCLTPNNEDYGISV